MCQNNIGLIFRARSHQRAREYTRTEASKGCSNTIWHITFDFQLTLLKRSSCSKNFKTYCPECRAYLDNLNEISKKILNLRSLTEGKAYRLVEESPNHFYMSLVEGV